MVTSCSTSASRMSKVMSAEHSIHVGSLSRRGGERARRSRAGRRGGRGGPARAGSRARGVLPAGGRSGADARDRGPGRAEAEGGGPIPPQVAAAKTGRLLVLLVLLVTADRPLP